MQTWKISELDVAPHSPLILASSDVARAIVLQLPEGERLQDHEVHEHAWLVVIDGEVEVQAGVDGEAKRGGSGLLVKLEPHERRTIAALADARVLIILAPWPGPGHPGAMTLDDKADVRRRAAEHSSG